MVWIVRLAALLLFVFVFTFGVLFCVRNAQPLSLDFVVAKTPEIGSGLLVLGTFLFGGLCGLVMSSAATLRAKFRVAVSGRRLLRTEAELARLKNHTTSEI